MPLGGRFVTDFGPIRDADLDLAPAFGNVLAIRRTM